MRPYPVAAARISPMTILSPVRASRRVLFKFADKTVANDNDDHANHLRKSIAVISSNLVVPAAIIWGLIYLWAVEYFAS
jgi:hypothetical protein